MEEEEEEEEPDCSSDFSSDNNENHKETYIKLLRQVLEKKKKHKLSKKISIELINAEGKDLSPTTKQEKNSLINRLQNDPTFEFYPSLIE